jgi:hypothetical protein
MSFKIVETRGRIKGILISKDALAVWDGSALDFYTLGS